MWANVTAHAGKHKHVFKNRDIYVHVLDQSDDGDWHKTKAVRKLTRVDHLAQVVKLCSSFVL